MSNRVRPAAGFSLLELLIVSAIFLVVMMGVYLVYESNQTLFLRGEAKSDLQQNARIALDRLTREFRMAGFGVPTADFPAPIEPIIMAAGLDSITFWADVEGATTELEKDVDTAATVLPVVSLDDGLKVGHSLYITDGLWWDQVTVEAVDKGAKELTVAPPLTRSYASGSMVSRPRAIRYYRDGSIFRRDGGGGGGAQPLAIKMDELQLTYFDATGAVIPLGDFPGRLADIRRVSVRLATAETTGRIADRYTVTADVTPPNLGL